MMSQKGSQILESIIRALIKLIPVAGESIDQATFGAKDAVENAELRAMIQDIYKTVVEVNKRDFSTTNLNVEAIIPKIIIEPIIQDVLPKLDNISPESFDKLIELMIWLQVNIPKNDDAIKSSLQHVQNSQNLAIEEAQKIRASQKKLESLLVKRLEKLESRMEQLASSKSPLPRRDLQTIYNELRDIEVSYLIDVSSNLVHASNLIQSGYEFEWAADFTELYGYAAAPFSNARTSGRSDLYAGFRIFQFKRLLRPLYVLPPTAIKLSRYVERVKLKLIDNLDVVQPKFFKRLQELFREERLVSWSNSFASSRDIYLQSSIYSDLVRLRPTSSSAVSNGLDAAVLNFLSEYNMKQTGNNARLGLITSSPSILRAANPGSSNHHRYDEVYLGLQIFGQSLIINPYVYSTLLYIKVNTKRMNSLINYANNASHISSIKNRFDDIRSWLDNPTVHHLEQIILEIKNIRESLDGIDEITRPFHDEVINIQLENYRSLPRDNPTHSFRITFEKTLSETFSVMSDLVSYLEPAHDAFEPFRDFHHKID